MAVLTDTFVRAVKPPPQGQQFHFDASLKGFALRVSQGGAKSFVLKYGRDRRLITIGRFHPDILTLSQARTEAKRLLAEFTLGRHRPQSIAFPTAVEQFLKDKAQARRPSTVSGYRVKLGRLRFKGQLTEFSPEEFHRQLDRIKAPSEKSHVLVASKVFFRWCIKRRYIDHDPTLGLTKPKPKRRTRILSDDEIRALWKVQGTFADYVRGLLCTAQRRSELRHVIIGTDTFTVPSEISKNHRPSVIPICPLAKPFIKPYPNFDWSREKAHLDKASGVTGWRLSDCRRTARSGFSMLRIPPWIAERILNHVSSREPLEETYDQYDPIDEKREALEKWEAHIASLLR
ncbi:MAG TPA: integrase family protein [Xanthobacteraceae bacterium]|jgi:hypothetical protein|nr:integrase family protein [Xanthobacteraceae bacterium]